MQKKKHPPTEHSGSLPRDKATPIPEVRDAGPEAMTDPPAEWDEVDEQGDESFPSSDPPGNY